MSSTDEIADTPDPPYYAVIFSSLTTDASEGYAETATRMVELAARQPGFLGVESAREELGITISYWTDLDSIKAWKRNAEHLMAQKMGREKWYSDYKTRIARVERDYNK
jgi:heme-degrading monooxygenase HmoA